MPADVVAALTPATRRDELALHLISGPYVVERGCRRELPENSRRVLALVALRPDWLSRATAAGRLWPGGDEHRAAGNLRSALWRMRGASLDLIEGDLVDRARQLIRGRPRPADLQPSTWRNVPELLPGRTDEWLEPHRDHLRLLVRSALRALSRHLTGSGRYAEAVEAALAAVALDPFDENARIALVAAHLAEGNLTEGRRAVATYRGMALRELGVEPNQELTALLQAALLARVQHRHSGTTQAALRSGRFPSGVETLPKIQWHTVTPPT